MTTLFIGLSTLDIQYFVDTFPGANVKVKTKEPVLLVGGPATNAAVSNAFLGGKSVLLSGVGQSRFRDFFVDDFKSSNISHLDLYTESNQLPVLASVITSTENGDRNIFTHNPTLINFSMDVKAILDQIQPDQIMIDGFYPEVALPICIEARQRNIPIVFDGGSWKPHLEDLLPLVDYAICSANFHPPACNSHDDVFNYLDELKVPFHAITNGSDSILFQERNNKGQIEIYSIKAKDTLGAGDFFHGAFCYYLLLENSFSLALKKASLLASKTCEYPGTRDWLNKLERRAFL